MKVIYIDEIELRTAISRKMLCPVCRRKKYRIIHQLEPEPRMWRIECRSCGNSTKVAPTRQLAKLSWKNGEIDDA